MPDGTVLLITRIPWLITTSSLDHRAADHRAAGIEHHPVADHRDLVLVPADRRVLVEHQVVSVGGLGQHDADAVADVEHRRHGDLVEEVDAVERLVHQEQARRRGGVAGPRPDGVGQVVEEDRVLRGLQDVELVRPPGRAGVDADVQPLQRLVEVGVDRRAERRLPPVRDHGGALGHDIGEQALAGVVAQLHACQPSR